MNIQKTVVISALSASLLLVPSLAFAQSVAPTVGPKRAAAEQNAMARLKTRGDNEITRRTTSLTAMITRLNNVKRLTADQKSSLTGNIQTEINNLNALKTKIDGDTDVTTLRTDVQSVVQSFRVYALYVPETRIIAQSDMITDVANELNSLNGQLQTLITNAKNAGKDVTQATAAMSDRTAKIADALTQAQNAINAVLPLTPAGYPGNVSTLQSARDMLKTARTDLRAAHQDGKTIQQATRGVKAAMSPAPTK